MLLDGLVKAIETVQSRIREHGNTLSQNEYRTRISLIDPILNALGWDVSDPKLVTPEYQAGNGRADYALLGSDGKPKAFVEAKRLNEHLEAHQDQVFKYTWDQKVFYGGLTDGNRWVVEDVTAAFSGREGRLLDFSFTKESAYQCSLKLLLLWLPTLATGQPTKANTPIIEEVEVDSPHPPPTPQGWISLAEYEVSGKKTPPSIRIPDKGEVSIRRWYDIFVHTAEWLVRTGKLSATECPVPGVMKGWSIVNSEPIHENGSPLYYLHKLSNSLLLNRQGSGKTMIRNSRIILKHCNQDPASILLKPD